MIAARAAPLREAPEIAAKQVGRLREGERVHVAGKVKSGDWYAVERKDEAIAYVATVALEDAAVYQARKDKEREQEKARQEAAQAAEKAREQQPVATAMVVKPAMPAAPQPSSKNPYDGRWSGLLSCSASTVNKYPPFESTARIFTVTDNRLSADIEVPGYGTPGHEVYEGRVNTDGSFVLRGAGENARIGKYTMQFTGRIQNGVLEGSGKMGYRECTLRYQRK